MKNLVPYLMFDGDCEEAMVFYEDCLGGEIGYMGRYGESPMEVPDDQKDKIMHVEFKFWGGSILASDTLEAVDYTTKAEGTNVHLSLGFDDCGEMHATFDRLKQGGHVTMELKKQFWGSEFGMLTDRFGIQWMFSCREEEKS